MIRALIIVAHGSSVNPAAVESVTDAARALAARPDIQARFASVRACFLKQPPFLSDERWDADESVVLPFFMSDGFFVQQILPRFIPEGVKVTRPIGAIDLSAIVAAAVDRIDPRAHLVLIGHGTEALASSGDTVEALAVVLRARLRSVTTAFVDQDPRLADVWDTVPADGAPVVVVPYFAFAGPHTETDIPDGLGLSGSPPYQRAGHVVHYAPPVGTMPEIVDPLAALALK